MYISANVTAAVGREAILTCTVHDLGSYKVGKKFIFTIIYKKFNKKHKLRCNNKYFYK